MTDINLNILTRKIKGTPLSAEEADANLELLADGLGTINVDLASHRADMEASMSTVQSTISQNQQTTSNLIATANQAITDAQGQIQSARDLLNSTVSKVDGNTSSINSLSQAFTSDSQAKSTQITDLKSRMSTAESEITTLSQTSTTSSQALASQVTALNTRVGSAESGLTSLSQTVTAADSATASSLSSMQTTLSGHTTSISNIQTSVNGISSQWGVSVNNNGRVTGLMLNSGADSKTTFAVMVDNFALVDPSNTSHTPFLYSNNKFFMDAQYIDITGVVNIINAGGASTQITGAGIKAGEITADKLASVLSITSSLRSPNYVTPASLGGNTWSAPVGFRLEGAPFQTHYIDGTTDNVNMEIGTTANMGGHPVSEVLGGVFNKSKSFTTPGLFEWVCPKGVFWVNVVAVGAGGGGAPGDPTYGCGGGGGGGAAVKYTIQVVPGQTYLVRVGVGGQGGVPSDANYSGYNGEPSYFTPAFKTVNYPYVIGWDTYDVNGVTNLLSGAKTYAQLGISKPTSYSPSYPFPWFTQGVANGGFGGYKRAGGPGGGQETDAHTLPYSTFVGNYMFVAPTAGGKPEGVSPLGGANDARYAALGASISTDAGYARADGTTLQSLYGVLMGGGAGSLGAGVLDDSMASLITTNAQVWAHLPTRAAMMSWDIVSNGQYPATLSGSGGASLFCFGPTGISAFGLVDHNSTPAQTYLLNSGVTYATLVDNLGTTPKVTCLIPGSTPSNNYSLYNLLAGIGGRGGLGFPSSNTQDSANASLVNGTAGSPGAVLLMW